jgi:ketosteroid isomerase-like protein
MADSAPVGALDERWQTMRCAARYALLVVLLGASGCASAEPGEEFTRSDSEAVRQRSQQLATAFNGNDMDAILDLYADNSVFMPPNAPSLRGREPLREFYEDLIARATNLRLETEDVAGYGPLAYETGTYSLVYQDGAVRDRGKYVFIWRRLNDVWRTEKTIWSSDLPPEVLSKTEEK